VISKQDLMNTNAPSNTISMLQNMHSI